MADRRATFRGSCRSIVIQEPAGPRCWRTPGRDGSAARRGYPRASETAAPSHDICDRRVTNAPPSRLNPRGGAGCGALLAAWVNPGCRPLRRKLSGVAEHGHFVRDVGADCPGPVRDATDEALGAACRCDILPAMRRCNSGTAEPGESGRITCRPTSLASSCPASGAWHPGRLRATRITSTKENNDDHMVAAAMDRQVRAHMEL